MRFSGSWGRCINLGISLTKRIPNERFDRVTGVGPRPLESNILPTIAMFTRGTERTPEKGYKKTRETKRRVKGNSSISASLFANNTQCLMPLIVLVACKARSLPSPFDVVALLERVSVTTSDHRSSFFFFSSDLRASKPHNARQPH